MGLEPEIVELTEQDAAVIAAIVPMDQMAPFFDTAYKQVAAAIAAQGIEITGPAFAYYRSTPTHEADLAAGFTIDHPIARADTVEPMTLPAGPAIIADHMGAFDGLAASWEELLVWARSEGFTPSGPSWEIYVTEPSPDMDPADLVTRLVLPGTRPIDR